MAIKLVIWDLDDTIWTGTLAEGDAVVLNEVRAGFIRELNRRGVISAVCSKNNPEQAKAKMTELGLWEETVFNRIAFEPKGAAVKEMIEDMQLRPANVLFVDDNVLNLEEVKHFCPEIETVNALLPDCDAKVAEILESVADVKKSRLDEYRGLERRKLERASVAGSNEDFLRACDIRVAVPRRGDNLVFAGRIEELINRTNQMNFTRSRVPEGSLAQAITGYYQDFDCRSLFLWDKFGYHGLVGFAAVSRKTELVHLTFSCRIMNMGIENWFLWMLRKPDQFPNLDISALPFKPSESKWVRWERYEGEVQQKILKSETKFVCRPSVRVIADCQSAAIAHYAHLNDVASIDQFPLGFQLNHLLGNGAVIKGELPGHFVYYAPTDYSDTAWPWSKWNSASFVSCAERFCDIMSANGRQVLLILAPETVGKPQPEYGVTRDRIRFCNDIWRDLARKHGARFRVLELQAMATEDDMIDIRHYKAPMMLKIGQAVAGWFQTSQLELAAAE